MNGINKVPNWVGNLFYMSLGFYISIFTINLDYLADASSKLVSEHVQKHTIWNDGCNGQKLKDCDPTPEAILMN